MSHKEGKFCEPHQPSHISYNLPENSKKKNKRSGPPSVTEPAEVERQKTEVTTETDYMIIRLCRN